MDRADLELLVALDDVGSITAAAGRLHTAQPALSRRLARIERELRGLRLFERGRHGTSPTPAGREVVRAARAALQAIADAEAVGRRAAAGEEGVLRLGTTPTLGADALPAALARLRVERPKLHLELRSSGDSRGLRRAVADGELDAALVALPVDLEVGIEVAWGSAQHFVLVLPVGDPLATADLPVPRRELRTRRVVALRTGEGLRTVIDDIYAELGVDPDLSLETSDREMLLPSVAAGLGTTIVPERFALQRAAEGTVVLPLEPPVHRPVGLVVRSIPRDPVVQAMVEALEASSTRD